MISHFHLEPFPHATAVSVLPKPLIDNTLHWMETHAPWSLQVTDFYEQWEIRMEEEELSTDLAPLLHKDTVDHLVQGMFCAFTSETLHLVEVTAHKLLPGQTIRVHNDYLEGEESHRLLIQLNRGWIDTQGGLLMLFGSPEVNDIRRVIRPLHASGVAFAISPKSFHAVSTVQSGERYTLVYSFKTS